MPKCSRCFPNWFLKCWATSPEALRYAFYVEPDSDPLRVTVVEKYPSRDALDAHNTGVLTKYLPRLLELLDGAPETRCPAESVTQRIGARVTRAPIPL